MKIKSFFLVKPLSLGIFTMIVGSVALALPAEAANLIVNGSFEEGEYDANAVPDGSYARVNQGSSILTGWDVTKNAVDWHNSQDMKFPFDGDLIVDLNLNGDISGVLAQTFATIPEELYNLSFYLSGPDLSTSNPSFPSPRQVRVEIAGVNQVFSTPASTHLDLEWEQKNLTFKATGNQTTLRFSSLDDSGFWGPTLDQVSVEPIPEPTTIMGLLTALSFGGVLKNRTKKKDI